MTATTTTTTESSARSDSGDGGRHDGRATVIALLWLLVIAVGVGLWVWNNRERPFGIEERAAWTSGRVSGSPEPPDPYQTARAYHNLTFDHPLDITFTPDGKRGIVMLQKGRIFSFRNDPEVTHADLLLDLATVKGLEKIPTCKGTGDSFGIVLHPHYAQNHYCYICYTLDYTTYQRNHENGARISRFMVSQTDPPTIDPTSEVIVLEWLSGGHDGGCVKFGPDGYLYISTGDGGDPNPPDPFSTGQDVSDLLSSVLRIDVDHPSADKAYSVPPDNPFVHTAGARGEVWCYGLRNPWRMNFDRQTGNLWIGDVGWELWESIDCGKPGGNYGWSIMEGPNPVHPDGKRGPTPIAKPQAATSHVESASITGGIVYRGKKLPGLFGYYLFGDWQTSRLWAAKCNGDTLEPYRTIAQTDQRIVAFGEDPDGEPVIVDHIGGGLWHVIANPNANRPSNFPRKLSETGLFASLKVQSPAAGVLPFSINAPQWVDGATAQRFVAFPGEQKMSWAKGTWGDLKPAWPKDSVLVRTLSLDVHVGDPASSRLVETQLLHFDGRQWQAYTYAWNDEQTDAELQPSLGSERVLTIADASSPGGSRKQTWRFAARGQCMTCHNTWCDYALAFNVPQLQRTERYHNEKGEEISDDEVRTFRHLGLLVTPPTPPPSFPPDPRLPPPPKPALEALVNPYDESADVNERARSYLHVNCSHCHRFGGGGAALIDVRKEMRLEQSKLANERPVLGDFGIDDARIVFPGDPSRSVLLYRACKLGRGRMPHIGSDLVDDKGTGLLRRWIAQLGVRTGTPAMSAETMRKRSAQDAAVRALRSGSADADAAVDTLLGSTSGALALLGEIGQGGTSATTIATTTTTAPSVRQAALAKAIASPSEPVRDLFRRFDPKEQNAVRLGGSFDREKLLSLTGDATRGRRVFFESSGGLCARCHRAGGQGTDFGPDLSHMATKYDKAAILENIVEPSKTITEGFTSYLVKTKSGEIYNGLLAKKTDAEVILKDATKQYPIPTADVQKMVAQTVSAMPEGLLSDLSPEDAADLMEYLASLK